MLPVFPEQVLDNSLHTAILIGLVVTWGLYELLGWTFAGFVVAGYLAALGMVAPASLAVVLTEAILCYGVVWALGVGLPQLGLYTRAFGRERFLLFVLVALPVRLVVTGLAMPRLEGHLMAAGLPEAALGLGLFGIGVVLVPLTANTFWKVGLSRGLFQVGSSTLLTWLVLSLVLVPFTNFGFGTFEQSFDALAVSAWTSSRAVLVLLVTVFVSARANLRFGWDFGGILVPSLLAMLVFTPVKWVTTVGEIVVLYALYEAFVRLPVVRDLDLEGPRRIVSIYAVAYAYKWSMAVTAAWVGIGLSVSDAFGFGYLLTSLVVSRAHKAGRLLPTLAPLLGTSLTGVALAIPLGLALDRLPDLIGRQDVDGAPPEIVDPALAVPRLALASALQVPSDQPLASQAVHQHDAPASGCAVVASPGPQPAQLGVLRCASEGGPWLLIDQPHTEPSTAWLAGWLARHADLAGVVVAGADPGRHPTLSADAPRARADALQATLRRAGSRPVLLVVETERRPTLWLKDPSSLGSLRTQLGLDDLRMDVATAPALALDAWLALRPQDGVLGLPRDLMPVPHTTPRHAPTLEAALAMSPEADADAQDLAVDVLVPALRRVAEHGSPGVFPDHLRHLASLVGASWIAVDGGEDRVLVRGDALGADRWVLRPGGSSWTVVGAQGWRWPGMGDVLAHHHRALDARLSWLLGRPPSASSVDQQSVGSTPPPWDRTTRALLTPSSEPGGSLAHLLLLDVAQGPAEHVVLTHGNEVAAPEVATRLGAMVGPAFAPWPGHAFLRPGDEASTWMPTLARAVSLQQALAPDQLVVAWFPSTLLRELVAAPDREARLDWYRALGVPVERRLPPAELGAHVRDPVAGEALYERLQAHLRTPTEASLADLQRVADRVWVWDLGLRRILVAEQADLLCTAVAGGGGAPTFPWHGCWGRR